VLVSHIPAVPFRMFHVWLAMRIVTSGLLMAVFIFLLKFIYIRYSVNAHI